MSTAGFKSRVEKHPLTVTVSVALIAASTTAAIVIYFASQRSLGQQGKYERKIDHLNSLLTNLDGDARDEVLPALLRNVWVKYRDIKSIPNDYIAYADGAFYVKLPDRTWKHEYRSELATLTEEDDDTSDSLMVHEWTNPNNAVTMTNEIGATNTLIPTLAVQHVTPEAWEQIPGFVGKVKGHPLFSSTYGGDYDPTEEELGETIEAMYHRNVGTGMLASSLDLKLGMSLMGNVTVRLLSARSNRDSLHTEIEMIFHQVHVDGFEGRRDVYFNEEMFVFSEGDTSVLVFVRLPSLDRRGEDVGWTREWLAGLRIPRSAKP
jgi:hypothetical protein